VLGGILLRGDLGLSVLNALGASVLEELAFFTSFNWQVFNHDYNLHIKVKNRID
jgi:hypothetical protein